MRRVMLPSKKKRPQIDSKNNVRITYVWRNEQINSRNTTYVSTNAILPSHVKRICYGMEGSKCVGFPLPRKEKQTFYFEWSQPRHFKTATLEFMSAWLSQTGLSIISYCKHWGSNMFHSLTLLYWGRFTLLKVVRCMEAGLLIFNVGSNRVTSSAHCFSMLLWSVICGNGRENVSIMAKPWLITNGWQISGMRMIWCYMPVPCQLWWRWLRICHGNYIKLVCNLIAAKRKIFTTKRVDHPMYVEVSQDLVHVLHEGSSHKYLGKHILGNLKQRGCVELHHRKTIAWAKFNKHRTILTNNHLSLKKILQCCCHASHAFQFANVGTDESAVGKHQRTTAQDVAINCWLGASEWRGLVWDDATNESQTQCGFGTLPYSTMDGTTCQTPISISCQDSIGAILVINCWTLDLRNWLAGELWQYAVTQAWTSTGKWDSQAVTPHTSTCPIAKQMARGGQISFLAKCSAVLCFTFCGPLGLHFPHVPIGS